MGRRPRTDKVKSPDRAYALILCLLCLGAVVHAEEAKRPKTAISGASEAAAKIAVKRGLDWLKELQRDDGSWSSRNYPAMTALPLWAFSRSDHPAKKETCEKAAKFLVGFVKGNGGIYKEPGKLIPTGGLSTYNTAMSMTALHAYDKRKYAQVILKAREFVAGSQLQGDSVNAGGFSYSHQGKGWRRRGDLSNTGWALMSMRETQGLEDLRPAGQKRVDVDWAQALKYVEKLQNRDEEDGEHYGGFGYEQSGERGGIFSRKKDEKVRLRGYGSMTYVGLESMIYAQVDRTDPKVRSALEWASRHWSVAENPGMGTKGLFYYYNIMSKALSLFGAGALKDKDGKVIAWQDELVGKLVSDQRKDGSWVNKNSSFWEGDAVLVTSYAILTLEYILGQ